MGKSGDLFVLPVMLKKDRSESKLAFRLIYLFKLLFLSKVLNLDTI